jgi:hypothetical protein
VIITSYGCALFRATLLSHSTTGYLAGYRLPAGVMTQHVHLSYQLDAALTVDNHEDGNTIANNSLNRPTTQLAGMSADEFPFMQDPAGGGAPGTFNGSFYGETVGMVVRPGRAGRIFRSELTKATNFAKIQIWIRAAE